MIDDQGRRAGEDGVGARAEIGDDQQRRGERGEPRGDRLVPRAFGLADRQRFDGPAGPAQRADEDRDRGQAVRIEMAEHDDRTVAPGAIERRRHRRPRRGAWVICLEKLADHCSGNEAGRCRVRRASPMLPAPGEGHLLSQITVRPIAS